ncbi:hypothetical protein OPQ81_006035 [Rhizoctonia solani]|nr:hypothetical protein OPQ81_006035 [Rhizoctonia solani]
MSKLALVERAHTMASQGGKSDTAPQRSNKIWEGENKIVIGIDIGTTQSGVAFTYLVKGGKQAIHRITQWPGQVANRQTTKVPTVVWYNNQQAVSFGAEALSPDIMLDAEEKGWALARNFKLHLHPGTLPNDVPLMQIYSDFMGYLFKQTKSYFEDHIIDGKTIWEKYTPTMEVIIAHPNGWYIQEQEFLRKAAVKCGVFNIPGATVAENIRFVTEAEASVHYCIQHTNLRNRLNAGAIFAVCDAGGSTVDTTLYLATSTQPVLQLKEVRTSASIQAGGIFINEAFETQLHGWMEDLGLENDDVSDYTKTGVEDFEYATKRSFDHDFDSPNRKFNIKVAGDRVREGSPSNIHRIHRGCVKVPSSELKECFDVCANPIISSVDGQLGGLEVGYILLVGGFGDSPYLRSVFKRKYEEQNVQVTLANDSTSYTCTCEDGDPELISISNDLYAYNGEDTPVWGWDKNGNLLPGFHKVGTIQAQIRDVKEALDHQKGLADGLGYWKMSVVMCIRFGGTELEIWAEWKQNGVIRTGPASLVIEDAIST